MKFTSILITALGLATSSTAWDVTAYPYVSECNVLSDGSYRVYRGTDSETCHNMGGGDAGASCRQFHYGGGSYEDCSSELITPASVQVGGSPQCKFYSHTNCRGIETTIEPDGGNVCSEGAYLSWACNT
ncbi:hypothetical protein GQX73_g1826 [Xylaria multiplex]|uniref:Secreted LysM effector LysM C-terminal domain-containing protein n=1 Tax=Xylaria multiplex TaxID=323545 RepID=A0A7C8J1K8_9PEZI|nr:hypothetical protein GQX73_g1826 [Xylaria multiplex]